MILTKAQAESVRDVVVIMHNVNGMAHRFEFPDGGWVEIYDNAFVLVTKWKTCSEDEGYSDISEFFKAYGVDK